MSIHITTAMVEQYNANVELLSQQKTSRFENKVRNEPINGENEFFDQIGATEATKRTGRHQDTNYTNTDHLRRKVTAYPWDWADLIDKADKVRILTDPQGKYTMNAVAAMNRAKDREIIAAATGTAYGGKTGTTAYSISNTVPVNLSGSSEGLTLEKLIRAKAILMRGDVDEDEELFFAYRAQQLEDMLKLEKLTSADYASVKALIDGTISYFMGFTWVHSELLTNNSSTDVTTCFAWARNGILLATAEAVETKVDVLPTKNYSVQVWAGMDIGATRMEEAKVVPVYCDESP
jgi:hypothetical protein